MDSEREATYGDITEGCWIWVEQRGATGWWRVKVAAIGSAIADLRLFDPDAAEGTVTVLAKPVETPVRIRDADDIPPLSQLGRRR